MPNADSFPSTILKSKWTHAANSSINHKSFLGMLYAAAAAAGNDEKHHIWRILTAVHVYMDTYIYIERRKKQETPKFHLITFYTWFSKKWRPKLPSHGRFPNAIDLSLGRRFSFAPHSNRHTYLKIVCLFVHSFVCCLFPKAFEKFCAVPK